MNKIIIRAGLWAAIICLTSVIIWIISFTGIALQSPLFYWTNLEDYLEYVKNNNQFFHYLAKCFMILFSLGYMILTLVFLEVIRAERQILAKIAVVFSMIFTLLSSLHYFVQISSVRFALEKNEITGLGHFLQANPTSFLAAVNMLGWTLFLGLSTLFMYLGLRPATSGKGIRLGLLINALACLTGGFGYLFQIDAVTFLCMNLGLGLALLMISISSVRYFQGLKKQSAGV